MINKNSASICIWKGVFLLILLTGCAGTGKSFNQDQLLTSLQEGGYIIFFRHAMTDHSVKDSESADLGNCDKQRNLSDEGRQQAKNIGHSFQELGIPVGDVITSQYCRCIDTANIAFHKSVASTDVTSIQGVSPEERQRRIANLRVLLNTAPSDKTNTIVVAHKWMFKEAAGHVLDEGEAAIFKPNKSGMAQLIRRVKSNDWMALSVKNKTKSAGAGPGIY